MDNSREYLWQCHARHVMRFCSDTSDMANYFDRWEKRHGKTSRDALRDYVVAEKERSANRRAEELKKQFGEVAA